MSLVDIGSSFTAPNVNVEQELEHVANVLLKLKSEFKNVLSMHSKCEDAMMELLNKYSVGMNVAPTLQFRVGDISFSCRRDISPSFARQFPVAVFFLAKVVESVIEKNICNEIPLQGVNGADLKTFLQSITSEDQTADDFIVNESCMKHFFAMGEVSPADVLKDVFSLSDLESILGCSISDYQHSIPGIDLLVNQLKVALDDLVAHQMLINAVTRAEHLALSWCAPGWRKTTFSLQNSTAEKRLSIATMHTAIEKPSPAQSVATPSAGEGARQSRTFLGTIKEGDESDNFNDTCVNVTIPDPLRGLMFESPQESSSHDSTSMMSHFETMKRPLPRSKDSLALSTSDMVGPDDKSSSFTPIVQNRPYGLDKEKIFSLSPPPSSEHIKVPIMTKVQPQKHSVEQQHQTHQHSNQLEQHQQHVYRSGAVVTPSVSQASSYQHPNVQRISHNYKSYDQPMIHHSSAYIDPSNAYLDNTHTEDSSYQNNAQLRSRLQSWEREQNQIRDQHRRSYLAQSQHTQSVSISNKNADVFNQKAHQVMHMAPPSQTGSTKSRLESFCPSICPPISDSQREVLMNNYLTNNQSEQRRVVIEVSRPQTHMTNHTHTTNNHHSSHTRLQPRPLPTFTNNGEFTTN